VVFIGVIILLIILLVIVIDKEIGMYIFIPTKKDDGGDDTCDPNP
jgi:hypothetical protein